MGGALAKRMNASPRDDLRDFIREKSLLTGGNFKLSSGRASEFFFDMKKTMFDPKGITLIADVLFDHIRADKPDLIGGLEMGAVPVVTAVCMRSYREQPIAAFFVRKVPKGHGTNQLIDGTFAPGKKIIIFDDVTTTGGSVLKAVDAARAQGGDVVKVVTIVDRGEGASENFAKHGMPFEAIFTREDFE